MDTTTQQRINDLKRNADVQKSQIDQDTAAEIMQITEQAAKEAADRIRNQGQAEAQQVGTGR